MAQSRLKRLERLQRACKIVEDMRVDLGSMKYSYNDGGSEKCFITAPTLKKRWSKVSIPTLFYHAKWNSEDHETVRLKFAKIISILIQIKWPRLLTHFESLFFNQSGHTDADLPFSMNDLDFFDQSCREDFLATQYTYMPFVIEEGGPETDLPHQMVLPFEVDPRSVGNGSFGEVYKVNIPRGCLKLRATEIGGQLNHSSRVRAFKQFSRRDEYKRELDSLNVISKSIISHENITRHTQAVSQGGWLRIFFPYAEYGSLEDLFEKHHESQFDNFSFTKENLISALHRMVDGVAHFHANFFVPEDQTGSYKYGAHLDLKPANVLVFPNQSEKQGVGTWKITDFGVSSFKDVKDGMPSRDPEGSDSGNTGASGTSTVRRTAETGPRGQLGTYCAPEIHPSMKVSFQGHPVDIWSIGCLLSNVVCFALDRDGIKRFRHNRFKDGDDYYFEEICDDPMGRFKLKDAVPAFLGNLLRDYPRDRRWVKYCLRMIADMLRIEPTERPRADSVRERLASIKFDEYELDPFEEWTDVVMWDTTGPDTCPIAQSGELRPQEAIHNDPRVSVDALKTHAELPLQMAHMTLKESCDEHQGSLGNELSQSSGGLAAETDGNNPALHNHESTQSLHTPSTHPPAASNPAGQRLEAGPMQGDYLHSMEHMFPDVYTDDPEVYVPHEVDQDIEWWLKSNESRSLWICVQLTPGWETNYAQVWANTLRLKISESGFPLLCYSVEDMNSAISEPVLEIARTLNSQMVRYEIERCPAQNTYVAHNLEDALVDLQRHLAHISKSLSVPIFCIIHGLEQLNGESRQGLQSLLRVLDECTVYRLKTLLTTNRDNDILEELKFVKCFPSDISGDYPLSELRMPSY